MTTDAAELADAVVRRLLEAGVTDVVLAPGSRNAPLSFAVWSTAEAGALRLHIRIDERSAGFLALGLTKVGSRAAVICTSGTAVANLHPAVLEAAHAGVAMVVISADRPARLRDTGANQTTDQVGIFGSLVTTYDVARVVDLPDLAAGAGPIHVNLQLDLPLVPAKPAVEVRAPASLETTTGDRTSTTEGLDTRGFVPHPRGSTTTGVAHARGSTTEGVPHPRGSTTKGAPRISTTGTHLPVGPRTVVVAGDDAGPPARTLAERAGWPLLAEPSSGSRTGANAIRSYRLLLGTELGERIERVVVVGRPTLSRPVTRLMERTDVEVLVVSGPGVWPVRPAGATLLDAVPTAEADRSGWLTQWQEADRDLSRRVDALLAGEERLTPYDVATAVSRAVPPGGMLLVGPSSPVRDLDLMARPGGVGERRRIIANRGLAGIDGCVSTAIGAALGRPHSTRNLALLGDLTFLHDQNGLVIGPDEPRPDLTIVVANDDGGAIFSMLEQGAPEHAASFERVFGTPTGVDLASVCAATRTPHLRVASRPELEQALATPNGGIEVIEAAIDRTGRRALDARIRDLAGQPEESDPAE